MVKSFQVSTNVTFTKTEMLKSFHFNTINPWDIKVVEHTPIYTVEHKAFKTVTAFSKRMTM